MMKYNIFQDVEKRTVFKTKGHKFNFNRKILQFLTKKY